MSATSIARPALSLGLPVSEFDAWEWRKSELLAFARHIAIPVHGTKSVLTARIRKRLPANRLTVAESAAAAGSAADIATAETYAEPAVFDLNAMALDALADTEPASPATGSAARPINTATVHAAPEQIFREQAGMTRSQALAAWYAQRRAKSE